MMRWMTLIAPVLAPVPPVLHSFNALVLSAMTLTQKCCSFPAHLRPPSDPDELPVRVFPQSCLSVRMFKEERVNVRKALDADFLEPVVRRSEQSFDGSETLGRDY